jgi:hypothetical protein
MLFRPKLLLLLELWRTRPRLPVASPYAARLYVKSLWSIVCILRSLSRHGDSRCTVVYSWSVYPSEADITHRQVRMIAQHLPCRIIHIERMVCT